MNYDRGKLAIGACVLFIREDKVLLGLRRRQAYAGGKWMLPGGTTDKHETARESAIREAREELGIVVNKDQLQFVGLSHWYRKSHDIDGVVCHWACYDWSYDEPNIGEPQNREKEKCVQLGWFNLNEVEELAKNHLIETANSYSILRHFLAGKQSIYVESDWPEKEE